MFTSARMETTIRDALRARLGVQDLPRRHDYRGDLRRPVPGLRPAH